MIKLSSFIFLLLMGCARDNPIEIQPVPYIVPEPSITLSAKLWIDYSAFPAEPKDYVTVVGTIENRHTSPLYPVKTELRLYFDSLSYSNKVPTMIAYGRIGFFGTDYRDGLAYATDTLRVAERMFHFTKSALFYWGGGLIWYDFRVIVGGIVAKQSGVLYEKDIAMPNARRMQFK